MYHKPRGSGGVWQQIGNNEAVRVTNKGKHLKLVIRAAYHEGDRSETGLAHRQWEWDRDLRLKLRVGSGEVTEGFSISKRTIDQMQNELVIRLDMLLYKVSKQMQFIAEVNTIAGLVVIFSVPFATHAHGRGQVQSHVPAPMPEDVHSSPDVNSSEVSSPSQVYHSAQSNSGNVTPETHKLNALPENFPTFTNKKRRLEEVNDGQQRAFPPTENIYQIQGNMQVEGYVRAVGFVQFSDQRLKTNIQDLGDALTIVQALSGKRYEWKDGLVEGLRGGHKVIGLIAQDVQRVLPEAVYKTEEGYLSVAYDQLIPVLINAIKEHVQEYEKNKAETNAEMEELKAKIDKLQVSQEKQGLNEVQELKNKLDNMKISMRNNPKYAFTPERREQIVKNCLREVISEIDKYSLIVALEWEFDAPEVEMCVQGSVDITTKFLFAHRQELKSLNLLGIKIVQDSDDSFVGNLKLSFGYKSPAARTTLEKAQPNITLIDCRNRKNDWKRPRPTELYATPGNEYLYTTYIAVFREMLSFLKPEAINVQIFQTQREVYFSSQRQYIVRGPETSTLDEEDTDDEEEDEDDSDDEDELHFKEIDNLAKLDTNPQKIAMMVDALNSNYQHAKVFESATFTNTSQKTIQTNPTTFNRSPNTRVVGNGNSIHLNNNQYQNYYQAPQNYSQVNNVIVAPIHPPQHLPRQAPNTAYYVQNHSAPPQVVNNNGPYMHGQPQPQPVYYYPPQNGVPQGGYYYVAPQGSHYVQQMPRHAPQSPSHQYPAPVVVSPQVQNYGSPVQPSSPQSNSASPSPIPSPKPSPRPYSGSASTGLARRTPRLTIEDSEYSNLPEEMGSGVPVNDGWKKFVHNLPFKSLIDYSTLLEKLAPNLIKGCNAIVAPRAKQYNAGLFVVVAWKGDFSFDMSLNSVFSSSNLSAIKHKSVFKNSQGVITGKFAVLYVLSDANDYMGEYEFTFSKEVQTIAKCIVGVFDVRQQHQDLTPKMLHLEDQLTTVDKKPTAYLTVGQMSIEWQKQR
jgi:hypothetical protein